MERSSVFLVNNCLRAAGKSVRVQCRCNNHTSHCYTLHVSNKEKFPFSNIFDLKLVEYANVEPADMEPVDAKGRR